MSDIGHQHIGSNLKQRRWKGKCAPISDVPNLQPLIYDVAMATQAHSAREAVIKCRCMEAPLCGEHTST